MNDKTTLHTVGWREWLALPELGIAGIKAKLDTGARTSALHTHTLDIDRQNGDSSVRFSVHPVHGSEELIDCRAPLVDERWVTDSGGHRELRPVIRTLVAVGGERWPIEVTLTKRETMRFHMLLGRTAMNGRLQIDPARSYVLGRRQASKKSESGT
ncbi:MAG: RimK/LysX family protein [Rhodanobacteraceae bacterium]